MCPKSGEPHRRSRVVSPKRDGYRSFINCFAGLGGYGVQDVAPAGRTKNNKPCKVHRTDIEVCQNLGLSQMVGVGARGVVTVARGPLAKLVPMILGRPNLESVAMLEFQLDNPELRLPCPRSQCFAQTRSGPTIRRVTPKTWGWFCSQKKPFRLVSGSVLVQFTVEGPGCQKIGDKLRRRATSKVPLPVCVVSLSFYTSRRNQSAAPVFPR